MKMFRMRVSQGWKDWLGYGALFAVAVAVTAVLIWACLALLGALWDGFVRFTQETVHLFFSGQAEEGTVHVVLFVAVLFLLWFFLLRDRRSGGSDK